MSNPTEFSDAVCISITHVSQGSRIWGQQGTDSPGPGRNLCSGLVERRKVSEEQGRGQRENTPHSN